jgi:hypothetical protein
MRRRFTLVFASSFVAAVCVACGSPAEPTTPAAVTPDDASSSAGVPLEAFLSRVTTTFCDFLTACKNDEVEVAVSVQMSLLALITRESLQARMGKTLRYDGREAARCLEAARAPFPACQTTKTVASDLNDADLEKLLVANVGPFREHFDACRTVIVGLVEVGQPCQDDLDCNGTAECRLATSGGGHVCKGRPEAALD